LACRVPRETPAASLSGYFAAMHLTIALPSRDAQLPPPPPGGGLDLAWNLKRGGPEISIDFIAERVNGQVVGHDIAFDYDNTSTKLELYWGGGDFPFYGGYTNSYSCGG